MNVRLAAQVLSESVGKVSIYLNFWDLLIYEKAYKNLIIKHKIIVL